MQINKINFFSVSFWCIIFFSVIVLGSCTQPTQVRKQKSKPVAKKCLDCHPEMAGKFIRTYVHQPVKEKKCELCHQSHGLVGGLFQHLPEPNLCYKCHGEIQPADNHKSIHKPVANNKCTVCHNPHDSDYENLLVGGAGNTSCFACHDQAQFENTFVHAPVEKGCGTCHVSHSSENDFLLVEKSDGLCRSCHDVKKETFRQSHSSYPVETGCTLCHNPHASPEKGFLKKNIHKPVQDGKCDSCHVTQGNTIENKDNIDSICITCHAVETEGKTSVHEPYTGLECRACHSVHASNFSNLFVLPAEELCLQCHNDVKKAPAGPDAKQAPEKEKEKDQQEEKPDLSQTIGGRVISSHPPFKSGECVKCHKGHASEETNLLQSAPPQLCQKCHTVSSYDQKGGSHPADQEKTCSTCHLPHESTSSSLIRGEQSTLCFSCHKKTASQKGMLSLHEPFARGKCSSCHQMHNPPVRKFLKTNHKSGALCFTCHSDFKKTTDEVLVHQPVAEGKCSQCHLPHAADFESILKQPSGTLCKDCHQGVYAKIDKFTVRHQPVAAGDCIRCHDVHNSPHENFLKKRQPVLCLECHSEVVQYWRNGFAHAPAVESCIQCHSSHGSSEMGMVLTENAQLCTQCHEIDNDQFVSAHQGIPPKPASCQTCHDSHGSPVKGLLYPVSHKPFEEGNCTPCHTGRKE